jgi:hypothetical protein
MVSLLVLVNGVRLGTDEPKGWSVRLLELLVGRLVLVELRGQLLVGALAESLLNEATGFTAFTTGEATCLDLALTFGVDGDLDDLQATPPTRMVSLIEPSANVCSVTWRPFFRASILAFSTA